MVHLMNCAELFKRVFLAVLFLQYLPQRSSLSFLFFTLLLDSYLCCLFVQFIYILSLQIFMNLFQLFSHVIQLGACSFAVWFWSLGEGFTIREADIVFLCQFNESTILSDIFRVDVHISSSDIVYFCIFDHVMNLVKSGSEQFTLLSTFCDQLIGDFALQVIVVLLNCFASDGLWFRQRWVGLSKIALTFLVYNIFACSLQQMRVAFSFSGIFAMKNEFILSILFWIFMQDVHFVESVLQIWELMVYCKWSNLRYLFTNMGWGVYLHVRRWWLIVRSGQR